MTLMDGCIDEWWWLLLTIDDSWLLLTVDNSWHSDINDLMMFIGFDDRLTD